MADQWLFAVVVKGFGKCPMILLTNKEADKLDAKEVYNNIEIYLTRWKCDKCYCFLKQSYNLEDVRVRTYNSVRNMTAIAHAIAYFTSIYMGMNLYSARGKNVKFVTPLSMHGEGLGVR